MNPTSNATAWVDHLTAWVSGSAFNLAKDWPDAFHLAEDLRQDGKAAITEAVHKGRKSVTYLKARALGAMVDVTRDLDLVGSVWSGRQEAEAKRAFDRMAQAKGRSPTQEEFAAKHPDLADHLARTTWQRVGEAELDHLDPFRRKP